MTSDHMDGRGDPRFESGDGHDGMDAPLRVSEGWGRAVRSVSRYVVPRSADELAEIFAAASRAGLKVALHGGGNSYGDAALNEGGLLVDTSVLRKILAWDSSRGTATVEPGVTIEDLWRRAIANGYWPAVVPGTQFATVAGCAAMNIHGKNNFRVGPFGDHVESFELVTPRGERLFCSRTERAKLFHAAISGFGQLGVFTKITLRLKRVETGLVRVRPMRADSLSECFDRFEENLDDADYLVGWIDCLKSGRDLGRGVLHRADHVRAGEIPGLPLALDANGQSLPTHILGLPKSEAWRALRLLMNHSGMRFLNAAKFHAAAFPQADAPYLQSLIAFSFLLDYLPGWKRAYGPGGLVQVQPFVPHAVARDVIREILERCQARGLPSYLGVLKRHRVDPFLLTHALEGWSLAMDFRVTDGNRAALRALADEITDLTLAAGGKFYFAKDQMLRPSDPGRIFGAAPLAEFARIKRELDPESLLQSQLARRLHL